MAHSNISIFVPHIGCPCKCSFCNQFTITEKNCAPTKDDVDSAVLAAISSKNYDSQNGEIAFFGGSFTAIDRGYMTELLSAAYSHIIAGRARGIRISTRPDCIDNEILDLLKKYGVTSIELGAQSMRDSVLIANNRGHDSKAVRIASKHIKEHGFELGLQMMTGLYGDDDDGAILTAREFVKLGPDTVRIYPTVVLKNTKLAEMYDDRIYTPQTIEQAVSVCTRLIEIFENAGIKIIRLGLHSIDNDKFVAGPWHPAFSELCENEIYKKIIFSKLYNKGDYTVFVADGEMSKAVGQKRSNIEYFALHGYNCKIKTDKNLAPRSVRIEGSEQHET